MVLSVRFDDFLRPFPFIKLCDIGGYNILTFIHCNFTERQNKTIKPGIFGFSLILMKAPCD